MSAPRVIEAQRPAFAGTAISQVLLPGTYVHDARARGAVGPTEAFRAEGPMGRPTRYILHLDESRMRAIKTDAAQRARAKRGTASPSVRNSANRAYGVLAARVQQVFG